MYNNRSCNKPRRDPLQSRRYRRYIKDKRDSRCRCRAPPKCGWCGRGLRAR